MVVKKFLQDDDGHWYMINSEDAKLFNELLELGEEDEYEKFCEKFHNCMINHPSDFDVEVD